MKNIFLIAFILVSNFVFSQKMSTRTGETKFEASMPTFEEVAGTNNTVSCVFETSTSEFASLVLVKSFKFKSPLMEEHFNENYMESTTFPKSTFKGKVLSFEYSQLTATAKSYDLEGDLTIHGVTKKIKTKILLSLKNGNVIATGSFTVKPTDYNIEIPSLVKKKISENVKISFNFNLESK
jgi:hypothetical protein